MTVGRLTPRKGFVEFSERCLASIVAVNPDVLYVIIGNEPKDAIGGYGGMTGRIFEVTARLGLVENVLLMKDVDQAL